VSKPKHLDDFGEIYPGFTGQRALLKKTVAELGGDVNTLWDDSFNVIASTPDYQGARRESIARETMRTLLDVFHLDPDQSD
jgi:hypothetical protein